MQASLIEARESFLSLLPPDTLNLIQQTHIQTIAFGEKSFALESGIALTGSPDDFVLQSTFRYNIRIYASTSACQQLCQPEHAGQIVSAARCSDAIANLYNAQQILDYLKFRQASQTAFGFGELELMLTLSRLACSS